jgi:exodeoxyribonuclease VII large subunit
MEKLRFSVSDFIALTNQTLEYVYPSVEIEGEVASFKVNQGKYVFFDLKDAGGTVGCFMTVWQLRVPIEDGMKVIVTASPKLTQWGKFSLTVRAVRPSGAGAIKKSFELLKEKLTKEGLFAAERKRPLPELPQSIAVISSTQAAGYIDFMKILDDRWGGMQVDVAHVQVQGAGAAEQMVRALRYFNERETLPEVIVLVRGGGSADDLSAFNDEPLVRAIAASRVPVITGIGHEIDESLADLAADVRAATPSNAAQLLVPDKREYARRMATQLDGAAMAVRRYAEMAQAEMRQILREASAVIERRYGDTRQRIEALRSTLEQLNPDLVLRRGYALLRGSREVGGEIEVETMEEILTAKVMTYDKK